uniref:(northern house mosquito) hypothetical protein n=1 Tax=Culex pipiens TaxID=7175 RepID=A0A8D8AWX8_CULPI
MIYSLASESGSATRQSSWQTYCPGLPTSLSPFSAPVSLPDTRKETYGELLDSLIRFLELHLICRFRRQIIRQISEDSAAIQPDFPVLEPQSSRNLKSSVPLE